MTSGCVTRHHLRARAVLTAATYTTSVLLCFFLSSSGAAAGASLLAEWVEHGEDLAPVSIASSVPLIDANDDSVRTGMTTRATHHPPTQSIRARASSKSLVQLQSLNAFPRFLGPFLT